MKNLFLVLALLFVIGSGLIASNVSVKISKDAKGFSLYRDQVKLLELQKILYDFKEADSVKVIDSSEEQISLLTFYTWINPKGTEETVQKTDTLYIDFKSDFIRIQATPNWVRNIQLELKDLGGSYYGLQETLYPDNIKSPNLRGSTIDVEMQSESHRYHENYASVHSAFFFNSLGYASFFDTFSSGKYRLAQGGKTILTHYTGKLDWYIFTGDYKNIYKDYYAVIGAPKYVPDWACGPVIWRDENTGAQEVLDDVKRFTQMQIPLTALFVDRPYSNGNHGWSKMDFSSEFSDPETWIKELNNNYGIEFMTWVASATFGDQDFPGLLAGHFGYFDLTNSEAVAEFQKRLKEQQYAYGVKGHKLDRAEEHFPVAEKWADKTDVYSRRNKYPYLYAKVTDSILNKSWGQDNVNFARAAYHRSQPYLTAVWGGDVRTNWDGLASNIANAMRCSFMGFSNWGTDVGGYLGNGYISEELYTRWLQFGLWTGFYEIKLDGSGGSGRERTPWQYDKSFQQQYASILNERMQLIPYVYSMLNTAANVGPLMKPMAMVYPSDERFVNCWDQYIFGEAFLVAPIYSAQHKRNVELPEGDWYDYYTGKKFAGGSTIEITKSLEEYPVFVKAGSIYVKGQVIQGNSKHWSKNSDYINLFYAPGEDCSFDLLEPSNNDKISISAQKLDHNNYKIKIPKHSLIQDLYLIGDANIKSVTQNGKRIKVKQDGTKSIVKNVAGSVILLTLE